MKSLRVGLLIALLALTGFGCAGKNSAKPVVQNPAPEQKPAELSVEDRINGDAVAVYENGALQSVRSAASNIYVITPLVSSSVGSTLNITGNARVFENAVSYRVKDASGAIIATGNMMANAPDIGQYGPYTATVNLSAIPPQLITLEVYWASAKDGSDADLVSLTLTHI